MIDITKLYLGQASDADKLRYRQRGPNRKPIVVWNITQSCNLSCLHCYANATLGTGSKDISTESAKKVIDNLADFKVPVLLFSGGEPLLRPDLPELATYAKQQGLRVVVSTNGTLITQEIAIQLKQAGVSYVGISLDGMKDTHNRLRQSSNAFERALSGLENARKADLKTGLRITINNENKGQIPDIFNLVREREINRICFYHLVGVGRGKNLSELMLSHADTRKVVDTIIDETRKLADAGLKKELLTVGNHADGPYLWLRLFRENPDRAKEVWDLLSYAGGDSSGLGIAAINWVGNVQPDQFWQSQVLGNVFEQPFSQIWSGSGITDQSKLDFLNKLRNKRSYVQGRCSTCRFLGICGGNFRVRAELLTRNPWAADPTCYLTDQEITKPSPYDG